MNKVLKSNPLKDPYVRELVIYLPPGYWQSDSAVYVTGRILGVRSATISKYS